MTTKLRVRGSDGTAAIYTGADDVLDDPTIAPERVAFHSDLAYMAVLYDETVTITLDAPLGNYGTPGLYQDVKHKLPAHNLGVVPFGVFLLDGEMVVGSDYRVDHAWYNQSLSFFFRRQLVPGYDATGVWLRDQYNFRSHGTIQAPARSVTLRVLLFAPDQNETSPGVACRMSVDRVIFGQGQFDTDKKYVRKVDGPSPLFRYLGGRTIDGIDGSLRVLLPNGGVYDRLASGETAYTTGHAEHLLPTVGEGFDV